jgi:hypothetical protein
MSWTKEKQTQAEMDTMAFAMEFHGAFDTVKQKISNGATDDDVMASYIAVSEVLRRWRAHSDSLQNEVLDSSHIDEFQRKLTELAGQQEILARLESEAGTRADQAVSVNPKVTQSPYTNILGLQRTFRGPTRTTLMIVGIVFAVMAVLGLGALVYRLVVTRGEILTTFQRGGGRRLIKGELGCV